LPKLRIIHRNILLKLIDLDREAVPRPGEGPAVRHFHAVRVAIIGIINLGGVAAERSLERPHEAHQEARLLIEIEEEWRLAFVAAND
jgi:hypothetical protein